MTTSANKLSLNAARALVRDVRQEAATIDHRRRKKELALISGLAEAVEKLIDVVEDETNRE